MVTSAYGGKTDEHSGAMLMNGRLKALTIAPEPPFPAILGQFWGYGFGGIPISCTAGPAEDLGVS